MASIPESPLPDGDARSSARWDSLLAVTLGVALLGVGWADTRSYLASLHKVPFTFSMVARPGGVRVGTDGQEFFGDPADDYARLENFDILENRGDAIFRHSLGPVSRLEIVSPHLRARLSFRYANNLPDQDLTVACNGETLEQMTHLPPGNISRTYPLTLHPGSNVVTFTYRRYLHDGTLDDPNDARPIAGDFGALNLLLE